MNLKSKLKAYESFDGAHGPNHALNVQRNALELAKHYPDEASRRLFLKLQK